MCGAVVVHKREWSASADILLERGAEMSVCRSAGALALRCQIRPERWSADTPERAPLLWLVSHFSPQNKQHAFQLNPSSIDARSFFVGGWFAFFSSSNLLRSVNLFLQLPCTVMFFRVYFSSISTSNECSPLLTHA